MARKQHSEEEVLKALKRKSDVKIEGKFVLVLNGNKQHKSHDLGNGSWGKIDFLVNHCSYKQRFVEEF